MEKKTEYSEIVSPTRFIIYSFLSLGIYEIIWFYRSWKHIKQRENSDIYPFFRAWFAIFYVYALTRKMILYAREKGYLQTYSPGFIATAWIVIVLFIRGNKFFFEFPILGFIAGCLTCIVLIEPLIAINFYYKKTEKKTTKRQTEWWHIVLNIIGSTFWLFIIWGTFLTLIGVQ